MRHKDILHELNQLEGDDARNYFQSVMRDSVRESLCELMLEEVSLLCGVKHVQNSDNEYKRAGSEIGIFYDEGQKKTVLRPRVRKDNKEVPLKTYQHARDIENISDEILRTVENGVSTRKISELKDGETISKSEISRLWIEKGAQKLEVLRSRDLSKTDFFCLMLDGVELSSSITGIVALGIDTNGEKQVLDFSIGATENYETVYEVLNRIVLRGFKSKQRLLCVLDGSASLKKAALKFFPNAVIQRCLVL